MAWGPGVNAELAIVGDRVDGAGDRSGEPTLISSVTVAGVATAAFPGEGDGGAPAADGDS